MRRDYYGTRFSVDLATFAGQHEDEDPEDEWLGDAIYAVQEGLQEFVDACSPSALGLRNLENGLRALGKALSPTSAAAAGHQQALQCVKAALQGLGAVDPFGSWVSGLHVPGGDLDLSLEGTLHWRSGGGSFSGEADRLTKQAKKAVLKLDRRVVASTWRGSYGWSGEKAFGSAIFSVAEPLDASDNVTRTVRSRANAADIVEAFEDAGQQMLEAMEWHGAASVCLRELFGDSLCYSSGAMSKLNSAYVEPVPIVPMQVPASLHSYVNRGTLPIADTVDHEQPRY
ncbi:DNA polymerase sigma [Chlorella sorokiniana]|uniref:DNA polymerase sigma n=1 Tax=Chlorella sorokiniana TaxID=3076 RepID=A0A2P6TE30_CHLSO|nr:DNA polymerase sigma [Chlorella sorokiniana]|eukprot:PRW20882.1 DNA polymerase sigma [Chlorella sorokiniana]